MYWRRKWQPTPVFLPGESQGRGSLVGCPSMGSHRVGHNWSDLAVAAAVLGKIYFFFFQNRVLLSALKTFSGRFPSSVIFFMASGNFPVSSWSEEGASPVIWMFLKPSLFLKLSNHTLLVLNSPALDPSPSFHFKLYNDFVFSWIALKSIGMPCYCSVAKSSLTLWDPMDCSIWLPLSFTVSQSMPAFLRATL